MKHSTFAIALGVSALVMTAAPPFAAQERIDADVNAKIRNEGQNNSRIMRTMHYLTDVYGPRLTGSPNLKAAGEWAIKEMASWGFENGRLEPWDFARPGWSNDVAIGAIISPVKDKLEFEVLAWTPSTEGTVKARAYNLITPDQPTKEELEKYLANVKTEVAGRIVLVGRSRPVPVNLNPPAKRLADDAARGRYNPPPSAAEGGGRGRGGREGRGGRGEVQPPREGAMSTADVNTRINEYLLENKVALRINDAQREHGQIRAFQNTTYDIAKVVPTVVMRNEDYGRIARILADGTPVELQFTITNAVYPEGRTAYNTIAEIPGSDKKDEVVMLGGHLDSWHSATGATDNAIGCAVMMEAARILNAIGVKPRRTIRVALWSGEEQGLLGSKAYVAEHFGTFEAQKPEYSKLVAYMNVDSGTGRVRGASVFGPPGAAAVLRELVKPFEDFGVFGAVPTGSRNTGGTDSTSFNAAGLAGIGWGQDPIEYNSATWHTNLDTYERIIEDDAKQSAITIASVLYHLAMRDEMLPRFPVTEMPPVPTPPAVAGGRGN
ncbi:MAG TPA: M20/M25/M40 family metallo-hydrolase [Vicinamibacterales bacterium]|nr:M20/M25/M40 family metallo-hydrolase [Vicinamibacterales bacterium]